MRARLWRGPLRRRRALLDAQAAKSLAGDDVDRDGCPMANTPVTAPSHASLQRRFFAFLRRRYPPGALLALAAFALSGVGYGAGLVGALPSVEGLIVALVVVATLAFQLAVADSLRDETHAGGVWSEPVPRPALLTLALGVGLAQVVLTLALHPPLLGPLALSWLLLALASQDFFIPDLARRPALSVGLHLTGLASAGYYAAGADLFRRSGDAHPGLLAFTVLTVAAGLALEIARKSRAKLDERDDAPTYTRAWGHQIAGMAVGVAVLAALMAATGAYLGLGAFPGLLLPAVAFGALAFLAAALFSASGARGAGDRMRGAVLGFVAVSFLTLGFGPLVLRALGYG